MKEAKEAKPVEEEQKMRYWRNQMYCSTGYGLPLLLIMIGLYYYGKAVGWFPDVPFWPIVIVAIGIWLLLKRVMIRNCCGQRKF